MSEKTEMKTEATRCRSCGALAAELSPAELCPDCPPYGVVAVASEKGGSAKTFLAVNLCARQAQAGRKVLFIDADIGGLAVQWHEARTQREQAEAEATQGERRRRKVRPASPSFPMAPARTPNLHKLAPRLWAEHDLVIIDCPPRPDMMMSSACAAADLVLIPCDGMAAAWALPRIARVVAEAREMRKGLYRPELQALVVPARIPPSARRVDKALARLRIECEKAGLPLLDVRMDLGKLRAVLPPRAAALLTEAPPLAIRERLPSSDAFLEGRTLDPATPAGVEISCLYDQMVARLAPLPKENA